MILPPSYQRHLQLPASRLILLQGGEIDLPAIKEGLLFVVALWSGASQTSFRSLNAVLARHPQFDSVRLFVCDTDEAGVQSFLVTNGVIPAGKGETARIRNAEVEEVISNYTEADEPQILRFLEPLI